MLQFKSLEPSYGLSQAGCWALHLPTLQDSWAPRPQAATVWDTSLEVAASRVRMAAAVAARSSAGGFLFDCTSAVSGCKVLNRCIESAHQSSFYWILVLSILVILPALRSVQLAAHPQVPAPQPRTAGREQLYAAQVREVVCPLPAGEDGALQSFHFHFRQWII